MEGSAAEIARSYLRGDFITGYETFDRAPVGFFPRISMGGPAYFNRPTVSVSPPATIPGTRIIVATGASGVSDQPYTRDEAMVSDAPRIFIDPEEAQTETVFETVDAPFIRFPSRVGNVDRTRDPWPTTVIYPTPPGSVPVAVDWGDILGNVVGGIAGGLFDPVGMGSGVRGLVAGPTGSAPNYSTITQPRTVTVDTVTGKITPCRRRRRRRLLTSSDLADLAALKAIVGGGSAMNAAVVKAVRR